MKFQYKAIHILETVRLEVFTKTTTNKILSAGHINLKQKPEYFRDPLRLYHHSGKIN
jgi:hypothetical protein